jgi:uncharacterized protein (DUF433 family)
LAGKKPSRPPRRRNRTSPASLTRSAFAISSHSVGWWRTMSARFGIVETRQAWYTRSEWGGCKETSKVPDLNGDGQPRKKGRKRIMPLTVHGDPSPLRVDEHGTVRVGDSQVLLDIVIREFNNGAEPEAIAHGYPTLDLADVYGVIAYYLRHRTEIDDYLRARRQEAEKLRQEIESQQPGRAELRAKLLARKAQMELAHASPGPEPNKESVIR